MQLQFLLLLLLIKKEAQYKNVAAALLVNTAAACLPLPFVQNISFDCQVISPRRHCSQTAT